MVKMVLDEVSGDVAAVTHVLDSLAAHGDMQTRGQAMLYAPQVAMLRGRPRDALQKIVAFNAFASSAGLPPNAIQEAEYVAAMDVALDRPAPAVSHLDSALAISPIKSAAESDRDYLGVAEGYAQAGRADRARTILAQRSGDVRDTSRLRAELPRLNRVLGEVALAEGHPAEATQYLWKGDSLPDGPLDDCDLCTYTLVGRAYDKANQPDSAIKYYEKSSASTYLFRVSYDMSRAPIERRLGELYEAKGDRDRAVKHYQAFVDFWKDAEPEFQPQVADVRKRLARLSDTERR